MSHNTHMSYIVDHIIIIIIIIINQRFNWAKREESKNVILEFHIFIFPFLFSYAYFLMKFWIFQVFLVWLFTKKKTLFSIIFVVFVVLVAEDFCFCCCFRFSTIIPKSNLICSHKFVVCLAIPINKIPDFLVSFVQLYSLEMS